MTSMQDAPRRRGVVVGVDTHKHIHVAVALDELGGRIEARSFAADRSGYEQLIDWASSLGREVMFGVEGTGSTAPGSLRRSVAAASVSLRCCAPTGVTGGCAASPTPSTPRMPRGPCSTVKHRRCRSPLTARWR